MGCELQVYEHDNGDVEQRLFVKGKGYPGLLMTRTLGDLSVKGCGITNMPEVVEWTAEEGVFLLIASDGLWELIPTAEIAQELFSSLANGMSRQSAVEKLVLRAKEIWMREVDGYCDDITALLVPLSQDLAPLSSSLTGVCGAGVCKDTCTVS
ncbi:unnamed protein product [Prorocentrum cordatum]|uniref:PPM-type phosphatase domain-containing protein n=1 Tax=Prorocentrum cordatum TaxID=2364126 RepID=A0ABN9T5C7_9DINO|nr:unnamed protein product [Polarella glacialis]